MKANELMIGDWVRIDEPDKYAGATGQIQSLMYHQEDDAAYFNVFIQGKFGYVSRDVCSDDIRPITLTAEILEKNGFKRDIRVGYCEQYAFCDNLKKIPQTVIEFSFYEEGVSADTLFRAWTKPESCDGENSVHICDLKYVHHLQHALRLCGIDKTIEL